MKLKSKHLTTRHHNYLIRVDQVGESLWMFNVMTLQALELTSGQGFLTSDSAEAAARSAIEEIIMQEILSTVDYKNHRIEVYPARRKKHFKSVVFDQAQRRRHFSEVCNSIDRAIALAKYWIEQEDEKC